jgi:signal transduction histidine kinase/DNA-binding response OmpR family regulator
MTRIHQHRLTAPVARILFALAGFAVLAGWCWLSLTSHPPRMGVNSAACLLLIGAALAVSLLIPRFRDQIVLTAGACVAAVSSTAVIGHAAGIESAYRWGEAGGMALPTSVAFVAAAIGLLATGSRFSVGRPRAWKSMLAAVAVAGVTTLVYSALVDSRNRRLQREAEEMVLTGGLTIAALLGITIYFWQTTLERNQQLALANRELAKANRAKTDFLAATSHEIRNPLNSILGMADLLWESRLDSEQRQYVEAFRRAGATLMTLINEFLDLSKIESGGFELESVEFSLTDVVGQSLALIAPKAAAQGVGLISRISPDIPPRLIGDPARLQQILINLLGNAVKFTPAGEIVVTAQPHPSGAPGHIDVSVSDTGIGIPSEKLGSIFEDFKQADSSTARKYGGTGLGLGVSRRLVRLMGGELMVQSKVEEGSTFSFTASFGVALERESVPSVSLEPAPFSADPGDTPRRGALRILLAEDSPDNRFLLQAYLKGIPHTLTLAEDGRQAVDRFGSNRYDLILMDIQMPVMDGLTAIRALRAFECAQAQRPTPIVALTANALPQDIEACYDAGCDAYVSKPVSKQALLGVIERWSSRPTEPISVRIPDGLEELVPGYLSSRKEEVPLMLQLLSSSDFDRIRILSHNMRGSGSAYGFPGLTEIGAALESSARQADVSRLTQHLDSLADYLDRVEIT